MEEKPINIESFERKVRRHEVTFSQIENEKGADYLNSYLMEHSRSNGYIDFADRMVEKIDKRVLQRALFKLPKEDREILTEYLIGTKQLDIANRLNISPSAINQRLDKIFYNYRVILCNDKEFTQTSEFDKLQQETEVAFLAYMNEVRKTGQLKLNLFEIKDLIKEVRKAIRQTIATKSNMSIREQLSKQIDYSKLDDKYIEKMNNAFAELGIEAHFENLKKFKGNIMQVLKMVDDFIDDLQKSAENKVKKEN